MKNELLESQQFCIEVHNFVGRISEVGQTCFVVTRFGVTSSRVESQLIIPVAYKEGHEPGDHFAGRILPAWIKNKNTTFNDT